MGERLTVGEAELLRLVIKAGGDVDLLDIEGYIDQRPEALEGCIDKGWLRPFSMRFSDYVEITPAGRRRLGREAP